MWIPLNSHSSMQQRNIEEDRGMIIILLQDMVKVVSTDIIDSELNG
jgi:hypothetical protein